MRLLYKLVKQLPKNYISKPAIRTLAEIDEMDGYKFEEFMKHVYEQLGYSVYHTPFSGDQGADLILTSKKEQKSLSRSKDTRVRFQTVQYRKLWLQKVFTNAPRV
jgi:HJR/Mrr/RecB family endonuclease